MQEAFQKRNVRQNSETNLLLPISSSNMNNIPVKMKKLVPLLLGQQMSAPFKSRSPTDFTRPLHIYQDFMQRLKKTSTQTSQSDTKDNEKSQKNHTCNN